MKSRQTPTFLSFSTFSTFSTLPALLLLLLASCAKPVPFTDEQINEYWTSGRTLPVEVADQFPLPLQPVVDDKGYNVLIDMAHECNFANMWTLPEQLNKLGYRSVGSHATVNTVLDPKGVSRIRIVWDTVQKVNPFVWWPNAKYHVIITSQANPSSQEYLPEEIESLKEFVGKGGGLMIRGKSGTDPKAPVQILAEAFGTRIGDTLQKMEYGKGRILVTGNPGEGMYPNRATDAQKDSADLVMAGYLEWLAGKQKPLKDEPGYPDPMWGGGGIYPELEENFDGIVFYYAANQKPDLLKTVREDIPVAQQFIQERLPSKPTLEPMYLILAAGGGGGWAVNIYRPKENGVISLDRLGILSIFAHELAHTMHGPPNDEGNIAGIAPIPNRGEAHAGWFQGKVDALFNEAIRDKSNRNCNSMFNWDPTGSAMNLATHYENEAMTKEWGYGKDWTKTWYMWQRLDDRYGPGWYPRWKYVQHTRWANDPEHRLTWDEMITDMSIAVKEDLFPFMRALGISGEVMRLESVEYKGELITLPISSLTVTEPGHVRIEEIE